MKNNRSLWVFLLTVFAMLLVYWPVQTTRATEETYHVDIATSPASGFLTAVNMAPGDQVTSILQVQNTGNLNFNYSVSSRLESGSVILFNKMQIVLSDALGILYEGALKDLQQFALGTIHVADRTSLTFRAALPLDSTNDYQAQNLSVAFDLYAVVHDEDVEAGDGCFEPPFSNNQFALHQKSTVPIKFHLHDALGSLDSTLHNDTRLVITGASTSYRFTVGDGTLNFDDQTGHYLARFSTFYDPVMTNGWYRATVYQNQTELCHKSFQVLEQGNRSNTP